MIFVNHNSLITDFAAGLAVAGPEFEFHTPERYDSPYKPDTIALEEWFEPKTVPQLLVDIVHVEWEFDSGKDE